ncbi:autotransporter outer membrane beta-barrel domain-containing protein [Methylomarinum vadi]|uniref:autotransporter outer membrane beta-barrel domain-containing protein n=1 Tax=Methylomarinum vadi TaxID=438855 RepID=UPI001F2BCDE1|nr:autotransporter outer membrane beta-barrel domain-containing protein [Methylomarinum vadi]
MAVLVRLLSSVLYTDQSVANSNFDALDSALFDACGSVINDDVVYTDFQSFRENRSLPAGQVINDDVVYTDFQSDCINALFSGDEALGALTPDEIFSLNTNITSGALDDMFKRLATLRQIGGGAGADSIVSRFDVYVNGHSSWQEYDQHLLNPGFNLVDSKVMIGADYRFSDNFIVGLSSSYLSSDATLKQGAGDIDTNGYSFSAYSSFYLDDRFFIDGTFSYSDQRHRTLRNISYTGVNQVAKAKVDSDTYAAGLVTGYNFFFDGWTFTPTARWMYRNIQLDGYSESLSDPTGPGGTLGLAIGEQEYESVTGNFGAQLSYAWSQPWGVLIPTLSGEYVHEFSDNSQSVNVTFVNTPTGTGGFIIRNSERDKDYAVINAGLSAQFAGGFSAFVTYEKLLDLSTVTSDSLSMGLRLELD